jgi:sugar lactone lactonase YvrE
MTTKHHSILGALVAFLFAASAQAQQVSTVTATNLLEPNSITADPNNIIYFTDASNNRILQFIPSTNAVIPFAGVSGPSYAGYSNGLGSTALFSQPLGIVFDTYRNGLVVVDQGNQVLRFVTNSAQGSQVSFLAGTPGIAGLSNGFATNAQFSYPVGIASDGAGNLYVADSGNNAIRRLDTNNNVSTVQVTNYSFYSPQAVVVDNSNNLWVADTRNNTICVISNISFITNLSVTVVAGSRRQPGTNDSSQAALALFDQPCGLLWDPNGAGLLISDTANETLRRLYPNSISPNGFSVQTIAGIPGVAGYVDGTLAVARLDNPIGLAVDVLDNGYYVVDRGNNALRRLETGPALPPISNPVIGYVTFVPSPTGDGQLVSQFNQASYQVFDNNTNIIAIEGETGVINYVTIGPTPLNPYDNTIPLPGPGWPSFQVYAGDGLSAEDLGPSLLVNNSYPDVTLNVISEAPGRPPSAVVSARFLFITASPTIIGNNSASVQLTDATIGAQMYYTLDGSSPVIGGANTIAAGGTGATISFPSTSNVTLTVQAFRQDFSPSALAVEVFNASNYVPNQISFGFPDGEASSQFVGSAGHQFFAPITLTLVPGALMYSLQFNVTVTNLGSAPAVPPTYSFDSMLKQKESLDGQTVYITIPPAYFTNGVEQSLLLADTNENLLAVGWLEVAPETNLFNTTTGQDLVTYSQDHETVFVSSSGQVVVGGYSFMIPASAAMNDQYQIQISRPSAAVESGAGYPTAAVVIQAPANTNATNLGPGTLNALKTVHLGVAPYLVGDVFPFKWFNAGDFGDASLLNDDVVEVFRAVVYNGVTGPPAQNPPPPHSDYFNAMDSSNGKYNNYFNGNDTNINNIPFGDNSLNVDDIYVTYRRSLDPSLTWYERFWTNGIQYAQPVPNTNPTVLTSLISASAITNANSATAYVRQITVAADRVQATAGQTVQVPIRVLAADPIYPIRVLALNVDVLPLDGSPALTNTVTLSPADALGAPAITDSQGVENFAATWLDSTVSGVSGTNLLGTVIVTLPPNLTANSSYLVHFEHFSASPNGLALFQPAIQDGLITIGSDRSLSSWNDGIPDWWRLLYFGTVSNLLSAANLDPDGDGASNWQEYVAGTNPQDPASVLQLFPVANFTIQWPSVPGKTYALETSTSLFSTNWTVLSTNLPGTGQTMQIQDTNLPAPPARFYRVLVQ